MARGRFTRGLCRRLRCRLRRFLHGLLRLRVRRCRAGLLRQRLLRHHQARALNAQRQQTAGQKRSKNVRSHFSCRYQKTKKRLADALQNSGKAGWVETKSGNFRQMDANK